MTIASQTKEQNTWCFRSETARLLALNVAQIHTGLSEGDASINMLTSSFQQLASFCLQIENTNFADGGTKELESVKTIAQSMSSQVNSAIMAFQFYDRLCQRLDHVQNNLHMLSELITDEDHMSNSVGWQELRSRIKSSYTMETEHKMHEAVMKGATIEEALQIFREDVALLKEEEDIELF